MSEATTPAVPPECLTCNPGVFNLELKYIKDAVDEIRANQKEQGKDIALLKEGRAAAAVTNGWVDKVISAIIAALVAAGFSFLRPQQ